MFVLYPLSLSSHFNAFPCSTSRVRDRPTVRRRDPVGRVAYALKSAGGRASPPPGAFRLHPVVAMSRAHRRPRRRGSPAELSRLNFVFFSAVPPSVAPREPTHPPSGGWRMTTIPADRLLSHVMIFC